MPARRSLWTAIAVGLVWPCVGLAQVPAPGGMAVEPAWRPVGGAGVPFAVNPSPVGFVAAAPAQANGAGWPYYIVPGQATVVVQPAPMVSAPVATPAPGLVPQTPATAPAVVSNPFVTAPAATAAPPGGTATLPSSSTATTVPPTAEPVAAGSETATSMGRPAAPFIDDTVFVQGGQYWLPYDIRPYTARFHPNDRPEEAIRRWILAATGDQVWHGAEVSALTVSPSTVKVYHDQEVQRKVADVLGRLLYYAPGRFQCRARLLNLPSVRWRSEYQARLVSAGSRSAGRQAWLMSGADANQLAALVKTGWGGSVLDEQRFVVANGQEAVVHWPLAYDTLVRDVAAAPTVGGRTTSASYLPQEERTESGILLRFSPLIESDAATIELDFHLSAMKLADTKKVKLDVPGKPRIDVPELRTAGMNERFRLPPQRALLVSLGLVPNFDPRTRLFKKESAELLLVLELTPDPTNTVTADSSGAVVTQSNAPQAMPTGPAAVAEPRGEMPIELAASPFARR